MFLERNLFIGEKSWNTGWLQFYSLCCLHVEKMDVLCKLDYCKFRERELGFISSPGITTYSTFWKNELYTVSWIKKWQISQAARNL